jgi:3-isopropylmalate/(R)-2-methylmalate dehydratase large subunit
MLADRIIASHLVDGTVNPGEFVTVKVDRIYVQDGNSPTLARLFAQHGIDAVFDPSRIGVFFDHSVIWPNAQIAARIREAEDFCRRLGLQVFRAGEGISHVVAMDNGWFEPGSIVIGTDSHTCTGGAIQALALGMGATDVMAAMLTGETWLRCPETVALKVMGTPSKHARAKDVVLYALATFDQAPFLYRSVEWSGDWVEGLDKDSADTIANMAVEMGAKCAFLPPQRDRRDGMVPIAADRADDGVELIALDIDGLPPFIAKPHAPSNAVPLDECKGLKINYVFVGSCANSRLSDIAEVAHSLDGRKVHRDVHMLVTPGSKGVYLEALKRGYLETLANAGAIVTPPGCGACLGTQGSIPASGDRVLSTMNRNFLGRMGNKEAEIYLSSPLVAAHTAIAGRIPSTNDLM